MKMNSSEKIVVYDWHPKGKSFIGLMSLFSFGCAGGCFLFYIYIKETGGKILSVCLCILFAFCGIGLLFPMRTVINYSRRELVREQLFLGRFVLVRKNFQFGQFNAILLNRRESADRTASCFIGLNCLSGRKLWIKYFSNIPSEYSCSQAENLAEQLSRDFQLPINKTS